MGEPIIDIVVCGQLCIDLLPQMDNVPLKDLPTPGQLFDTGPMDISTGGAVANTGLALHQLGVRVKLMSIVGDDLVGQMILSFLRERDPALTEFIHLRKDTPASYTVVLSPQRSDRIFLHCPATNALFGYDDIDFWVLPQAKLFYFGYPPLLPRMMLNDGEELERIFQQAKSTGIATSLDMSLPDLNGPAAGVNWPKLVSRTLPYVDIFVPSIEEILYMLRREDFFAWRGQVLSHLTRSYLETLARELLDMGPAVVGFKLGEMGIYLQTNHISRFDALRSLPISLPVWENAQVYHPAFQVDVAGTTGAGDSAYAGLLSAMLRGSSPQETARWACAVGACNVEASDATSGIRTWEATQARMDAGWPPHNVRLQGF
jgi:sugar/nucleoside kinase (ribokinase family)